MIATLFIDAISCENKNNFFCRFVCDILRLLEKNMPLMQLPNITYVIKDIHLYKNF